MSEVVVDSSLWTGCGFGSRGGLCFIAAPFRYSRNYDSMDYLIGWERYDKFLRRWRMSVWFGLYTSRNYPYSKRWPTQIELKTPFGWLSLYRGKLFSRPTKQETDDHE